MPTRERLTERVVKAATPDKRQYHISDSEVIGLSVCVMPTGGRSFVLTYRFMGRKHRYTLGKWPDWSVTAARDRAKELKRQIELGEDPMERRTTARAAPRIADLVERYEDEHLPRLAERNASDQKSMLRNFVLPAWGNRLVTEITPMDVDALLTTVAKGRHRPTKGERKDKTPPKATPIRANRCGEMLRKMFNLSVKPWKMREDNPADAFRRRAETERDRFLSPEEITALAAALAASPDQRGASIIRMCLLTGARLGEVREARFEQFDLEYGIWTKQAANTKQRKIHRIPVSDDVIALVRQRRGALNVDRGWLFPGEVEGQPVQDLRKFWYSIRKASGLPDVRIHDLRHTFASMLVSGGASLEMIGKLLGHTQAKTTQRYAHLMDSPLRAGVNHVAGMVQPTLRVVEDGS